MFILKYSEKKEIILEKFSFDSPVQPQLGILGFSQAHFSLHIPCTQGPVSPLLAGSCQQPALLTSRLPSSRARRAVHWTVSGTIPVLSLRA